MALIIECELCPHHCRLREGERGNCRARAHLDGKLQTLVYGKPCAIHVDPIEKKPLYHFLPGSGSFSIATAGCNGHCKFCQNWQISQSPPEETTNEDLPPQQVVAAALESNCRSIAYTYTDPVIFYEYFYDTSILAHQQGLRNLMITAGYIEQKPLVDLCPYLDAANVDIKGIREDYYQTMCSLELKPVQAAIKTMLKNNVWVELTNLIVPTWNDSDSDIRGLCQWIVNETGPDTPLHLLRFWPMHKLLNLPPTPEATLERAWEIAKATGLRYVYLGNIPNHPSKNTYCPKDHQLLIRRIGYQVLENHLVEGKCKFCGTKIPGVWK